MDGPKYPFEGIRTDCEVYRRRKGGTRDEERTGMLKGDWNGDEMMRNLVSIRSSLES